MLVDIRAFCSWFFMALHFLHPRCFCLALRIYITGQPGDITDLRISSNTISTCSFVLQWSRPSSDPYSYTVIISTEGGSLIITDNTTLTNYSATGLYNNTVYNVSVTPNNVCGSSNTATVNIMTKRNGT